MSNRNAAPTPSDDVLVRISLWSWRGWRFWVLVIFLGAFSLWLSWFWIAKWLYPNLDARGTSGEMFGSLNTLFSALAFGSLIIAVFLQREDLRLQRQEMEDTREVLMEQRHQLERQASLMKLQAFETTFFNLLRLLRDAVVTIAPGYGFSEFRKAMVSDTKVVGQGPNLVRFGDVWKLHGSFLTAYFNTLDNALEFAETGPAKHEFYVRLLVSQMSRHELVVLACAALTRNVPPGVSSRVHRYQFFDLLTEDDFGPYMHGTMLDWIAKERPPMIPARNGEVAANAEP